MVSGCHLILDASLPRLVHVQRLGLVRLTHKGALVTCMAPMENARVSPKMTHGCARVLAPMYLLPVQQPQHAHAPHWPTELTAWAHADGRKRRVKREVEVDQSHQPPRHERDVPPAKRAQHQDDGMPYEPQQRIKTMPKQSLLTAQYIAPST